jgi:hypothetical protein
MTDGPSSKQTDRQARHISALYFFRAGFSAVWVTLVYLLASSARQHAERSRRSPPRRLSALGCHSDDARRPCDPRSVLQVASTRQRGCGHRGGLQDLNRRRLGPARGDHDFRRLGDRRRRNSTHPRCAPTPNTRRTVAHDHQRRRSGIRRDHIHRMGRLGEDRALGSRPIFSRRRPHLVRHVRDLAPTPHRVVRRTLSTGRCGRLTRGPHGDPPRQRMAPRDGSRPSPWLVRESPVRCAGRLCMPVVDVRGARGRLIVVGPAVRLFIVEVRRRR